MLPGAVTELRKVYQSIDELIGLLSALSGRDVSDTRNELADHLALRAAFMLIGEAETAGNHRKMSARLAKRLGKAPDAVKAIVSQVASALINRSAAEVEVRSGVSDLSYWSRQEMFREQGGRCAVCGWLFSQDDGSRSQVAGQPTLDHRIPYQLGGDSLPNLRIVCTLCNANKRERLHVGEHGVVWSNNYIYCSNHRAIAFWTMVRDRRCRVVACDGAPDQCRLFVVRRGDRGQWNIDNCITVCEAHRGDALAVNY